MGELIGGRLLYDVYDDDDDDDDDDEGRWLVCGCISAFRYWRF